MLKITRLGFGHVAALAVMFLLGIFFGLLSPLRLGLINKTPNGVQSDLVMNPTLGTLTTGQSVDEDIRISARAISGDLDAAVKLYSNYTYQYRDFEKAYYWGSLAERLGYDIRNGGLASSAEANIRAKIEDYMSRHPAPSDSAPPPSLLPPIDE